MKKIILILAIFSFFSLSSGHAEITGVSAGEHIKRGETLFENGFDFQAVGEFRSAIAKGAEHPDVFRYLSLILYNLGFPDEAIIEMEKAFRMAPDSVPINMELGIFFFVQNRFDKAKERFFTVLRMNPGYSDAYYYLGEIFLKTGDYDAAWLSARMAKRLGHGMKNLMQRLETVSKKPEEITTDNNTDELCIRQILVDTGEKADEILKRIAEGELFEDAASRELAGPSANMGGFTGCFKPSQVNPRISEALLERDVFAAPVMVDTERGFHIIQRILPFNPDSWKKFTSDSAGSGTASVTVSKSEVKSEDKKGKKEKLEQKDKKNEEKSRAFYVYAGAYKDEKNADEIVKDLRELGFQSYHYLKGGWFNVIAGRYNSYSKARDAGIRLNELGYEYYIP